MTTGFVTASSKSGSFIPSRRASDHLRIGVGFVVVLQSTSFMSARFPSGPQNRRIPVRPPRTSRDIAAPSVPLWLITATAAFSSQKRPCGAHRVVRIVHALAIRPSKRTPFSAATSAIWNSSSGWPLAESSRYNDRAQDVAVMTPGTADFRRDL